MWHDSPVTICTASLLHALVRSRHIAEQLVEIRFIQPRAQPPMAKYDALIPTKNLINVDFLAPPQLQLQPRPERQERVIYGVR